MILLTKILLYIGIVYGVINCFIHIFILPEFLNSFGFYIDETILIIIIIIFTLFSEVVMILSLNSLKNGLKDKQKPKNYNTLGIINLFASNIVIGVIMLCTDDKQFIGEEIEKRNIDITNYKYCTNCGQKISNNDKFCQYCGTITDNKINQESEDKNESI